MAKLSEEVIRQMEYEGRRIPNRQDYQHSGVIRNKNCRYDFKYDCRGCRYSQDPALYDGGCTRSSPPPEGRIPWAQRDRELD